VAGGRPARDPDGTFDSGINKRQGDENIEEAPYESILYRPENLINPISQENPMNYFRMNFGDVLDQVD
jgi:hypothetical protein